VQRLAGITVAHVETIEHVLLVPVQGDGPVGLGERQRGEISRLAAGIKDGVEDFFHGCLLPGDVCSDSARGFG
jgi:hypothetical protein